MIKIHTIVILNTEINKLYFGKIANLMGLKGEISLKSDTSVSKHCTLITLSIFLQSAKIGILNQVNMYIC